MLPTESKGTGHAEIVAVAVAVPRRDWRERFQAIGRHPLPVLFDGVAAHKTAQSGRVRPVVVVIIFVQVAQQLFRLFVLFQISNCLLHRSKSALPPGAAGRQRQYVNPRNVLFLFKGRDVLIQRVLHGLIGHVKIHPSDALRLNRQHQHGQDQYGRQKPLHILTSWVRI